MRAVNKDLCCFVCAANECVLAEYKISQKLRVNRKVLISSHILCYTAISTNQKDSTTESGQIQETVWIAP